MFVSDLAIVLPLEDGKRRWETFFGDRKNLLLVALSGKSEIEKNYWLFEGSGSQARNRKLVSRNSQTQLAIRDEQTSSGQVLFDLRLPVRVNVGKKCE